MPKDIKESKKKVVIVEEVTDDPKNEVQVEEPKKEEVDESTPVVEEHPAEKVIEVGLNNEEEEKTNYLWIIIPTALLIGALVGGLITYFSGISKLNVEPVSSPESTTSATVEPTPTASPSSTVKRDLIKLQVLNGSGVSGLAGKAKTYLEGLGYKDVQTGNASMSDLVETTISVKDEKKDMLETIISDLSKNYKVAEKTETLAKTSKYDFVITLGSK